MAEKMLGNGVWNNEHVLEENIFGHNDMTSRCMFW